MDDRLRSRRLVRQLDVGPPLLHRVRLRAVGSTHRPIPPGRTSVLLLKTSRASGHPQLDNARFHSPLDRAWPPISAAQHRVASGHQRDGGKSVAETTGRLRQRSQKPPRPLRRRTPPATQPSVAVPSIRNHNDTALSGIPDRRAEELSSEQRFDTLRWPRDRFTRGPTTRYGRARGWF